MNVLVQTHFQKQGDTLAISLYLVQNSVNIITFELMDLHIYKTIRKIQFRIISTS